MGNSFFSEATPSATNLSFNFSKNGCYSQMISLFSFNLQKYYFNYDYYQTPIICFDLELMQ